MEYIPPTVTAYEAKYLAPKSKKKDGFMGYFVAGMLFATFLHFYVEPLLVPQAEAKETTTVIYEGKVYKDVPDFCTAVRKANKLAGESPTSDLLGACGKK